MDEDEFKLPERTKRMLLDMVPTISFMMVFFVIFTAPEGGTFYQRLEKFDGLIAGALAIFAAAVTVRAMYKTDAEQERRHRREIFLMKRDDNAKALRLLGIVPPDLKRAVETIERFRHVIPEGQWEPQWTKANMVAAVAAIAAGKKIGNIIDSTPVKECEPLFSPWVAIDLEECREYAAALNTVFPVSPSILAHLFNPDEEARPEWIDQAFVPVLLDLSSRAEVFAERCEQWAAASVKETL